VLSRYSSAPWSLAEYIYRLGIVPTFEKQVKPCIAYITRRLLASTAFDLLLLENGKEFLENWIEMTGNGWMGALMRDFFDFLEDLSPPKLCVSATRQYRHILVALHPETAPAWIYVINML
jgi:hypothetical protein